MARSHFFRYLPQIVDLIPNQGGSADHHIVLAQLKALPALPDLSGELSVVLIELLQVGRNGNVTGGDAAVLSGHHRVDGQAVVLHQFVSHRQQVKVLHPGRRLSNTPAQKHIELITPFLAQAHQSRHIQGFYQGHHGHGRLHPQFKGQRPGGAFWIYFFHIVLHSVYEVRFGWPW